MQDTNTVIPRDAKWQLYILAICRFGEPVAIFSILPYLPEMLEDFGIPNTGTGTWVGIVSGTFALCECLGAVPWVYVSERLGRKPVIILGLVIQITSNIIIGFSGSLAWLVGAVAFAGLATGNVGVLRTMIAEIVPQEEFQAKAFSYLPIAGGLGAIIGPALGGMLTKPADRFPFLFAHSAFFKRYPFSIPCLLSTFALMVGLWASSMFLKETMRPESARGNFWTNLGRSNPKQWTAMLHHDRNSEGMEMKDHDEAHSLISNDACDESKELMDASIKLSKDRKDSLLGLYLQTITHLSNKTLLIWCLLNLHLPAYDSLLPVFMHFPFDKNSAIGSPEFHLLTYSSGHGMSTAAIGVILTIYGICVVLFLIFAYDYFVGKYGHVRCLKFSCCALPAVYFIMPFTAVLPAKLARESILFAIMLGKLVVATFIGPCSMVLLTRSVSAKDVASLHSIAATIGSICVALGSMLSGAAFSFGVSINYAILPWWAMTGVAVVGAALLFSPTVVIPEQV